MNNSERFKKLKLILRLFAYTHPYKHYFVVVFLGSMLSTLLHLVPTYLMKPLTDKVFAPVQPAPVEQRILVLNFLIITLVLVYVVQTVLSSILKYRQDWLGEKIGVSLRNELYNHLQKLSLKFYNVEKVGGLYSRVCHDTASIQHFFVFDSVQLFIYLVMFLGIGVVLFYLEWRLAILLLVPMPIIIMLSRTFGERIILTYRRLYQKRANMSSVVFNALKGIIVVKTNVAEEKEAVKFNQVSLAVSTEKLHYAKLNFLFLPLMGFVIFLSGIVVRWFGGWQVIKGELTLGEMMVFIGYMWQFYGPIHGINSIYSQYQDTVAAGERVFQVLDTEPDIRNIPSAIELPPVQGIIRFDHVSFSYDGKKNVLEGIDLEVKPGEILGIVGLSGGGKSTLAHLLCRLYEVTNGAITIDGYDIRSVKVESLRSQIGLILQDTILFYGTVAENITYGKPEASKIEIIFAAKAAGAHDFVMRLPDAYDTILGEGGAGLSTGERQRLSIARVLLKNPRIIIFDEATSSVDLATQAIIQATIEKLAEERTVLIISHSSSMLKITDRLMVIDKGKVVQRGTYDSLNQAEGVFSRLLKEKKVEKMTKESQDIYVV